MNSEIRFSKGSFWAALSLFGLSSAVLLAGVFELCKNVVGLPRVLVVVVFSVFVIPTALWLLKSGFGRRRQSVVVTDQRITQTDDVNVDTFSLGFESIRKCVLKQFTDGPPEVTLETENRSYRLVSLPSRILGRILTRLEENGVQVLRN